MQFSITLDAVFLFVCVFTVESLFCVLSTFSANRHDYHVGKILVDFLIFKLPRITIIIPMANTAPNSRTALSGKLPPSMPKIMAVPIMISAPPIIIKIPSFLDGSFRVIKNDIISMAAGIMPKIDPLIEAFI